MISMDLKQQILHLYRVDEMSLREIARTTGADRLCHKAFMVNMTGPSYRVKETQNIFKKL